ncbi:class II aminoacyl-tRNA and biotin synthetases superfamily protein [Actinidia rufa]|uniref:Class II aminoacyl-tRNA and biotin synthetases superfamily protein n=1 Tax=Actinidia rufa TaxID=165716 RepID=A0A7J0FQA2_9ERIC|nr:class II aminoacyl-tRNA and biotin synthetases superfamily protein [Actinidia rufa]
MTICAGSTNQKLLLDLEHNMSLLSQFLRGGQQRSSPEQKKEAAKLEKQRRREAATVAAADTADTLADNYGDVPLEELQSKAVTDREWAEIGALTADLEGRAVLFALRRTLVSPQMVKFITCLSRESYVDVHGIVSVPKDPIKGASQQVEIQVRKLYCINKALPSLPINIEDAARSEVEIEKALQAGEQLVRVNQDTRLNFRVLDLRTPANQGIFRIQCQVENVLCHVDKKGWDLVWILIWFLRTHSGKIDLDCVENPLLVGSLDLGISIWIPLVFGTTNHACQDPYLVLTNPLWQN